MYNLYLVHFFDIFYHTVAINSQQAIKNIYQQYGQRHIPFEATIISNIDGFKITTKKEA